MLLIGMASILSVSLSAQVTITKSSLINAGKSFTSYDDTLGTALKSGGMGDLTWDFSSLRKDDSSTLTSLNPDWNPSISSLMPTANLFLQTDGDDDYIGLNKTDSVLYFVGTVVDTGAGPLEVDEFSFAFLPIPITHGTVYHDTIELATLLDSVGLMAGPGSTIDSTRVVFYMAQRFEGIGHGKIDFGTSEIDNVLMVDQLNELYLKAWAKFNGTWIALPPQYYSTLMLDASIDTSHRHMWWSDNASKGIPVVQYDIEQGSNISDGIEYIPSPAQTASSTELDKIEVVVYPNPSANAIQFKGISEISGKAIVYDLKGSIVLEKGLKNSTLDVSSLTAGSYVVVIKTKGNRLTTEFTKK